MRQLTEVSAALEEMRESIVVELQYIHIPLDAEQWRKRMLVLIDCITALLRARVGE
jgi:hypothetical protein